MSNSNSALTADNIAAIGRHLDHMQRIIDDTEGRYHHASDAGAELAAAVYSYLQDPEGTGTDSLREAYNKFMGAHSGNFYPAPVNGG